MEIHKSFYINIKNINIFYLQFRKFGKYLEAFLTSLVHLGSIFIIEDPLANEKKKLSEFWETYLLPFN